MNQLCIVCGKSYISKRKKQYCSGACRNKMWKVRNRETYLQKSREYTARAQAEKCSLRDKQDDRFCVFCESRYKPNKYHPEQQCCSAKCSRKLYQHSNTEKVKEWKRRERQKNKERYRETNLIYKDKLRFSGNRLRALNRDNFTCADCAQGEPSVRLIVHHIDFSGQSSKPNNRIENLETLCRACHIRKHTHVLNKGK